MTRASSDGTPGGFRPGEFVDASGAVVGTHAGHQNFTIGQRKGLGVALGERRYVLKIVPSANEVVLGEREELLASGLRASRVNWLIEPPTGPLRCRAKIRYRAEPAPATVVALVENAVRVEFETPQSAITPGQAVVFYDGDRVLGGGWIERAVGPV